MSENDKNSSRWFADKALIHLLRDVLGEVGESGPFQDALHSAGIETAQDLLMFSLEDWKTFEWKDVTDNRTRSLNFTQARKLDAVRAWHNEHWTFGTDPNEFFLELSGSDFTAFRTRVRTAHQSPSRLTGKAISRSEQAQSNASSKRSSPYVNQGSKNRVRKSTETLSDSDDDVGTNLYKVNSLRRRKVIEDDDEESIECTGDPTLDNESDSSSQDEVDSIERKRIHRASRRNFRPMRRLANAKKKLQNFWENDKAFASDDDELFEFDALGYDDDVAAIVRRSRPRRGYFQYAVGAKALPLPLPGAEQTAVLAEIGHHKPADCLLQQLLWHIDCRYTLLSHQFEGVRSTAGVADDYPMQLVIAMTANTTRSGGLNAASQMLSTVEWDLILRRTKFSHLRGVLMADVMGLGKTVQGVVACLLRNAITSSNGNEPKPTILVGPNEAVLNQWADTLISAGVPSRRIVDFGETRAGNALEGPIFVLLTRYQLQTESKSSFELAERRAKEPFAPEPSAPVSALFPGVTYPIFVKFHNMYRCNAGKETNKYDERGENVLQCTTRLFEEAARVVPHEFQTVIIDEAHFHRNLLAYWGLGAALLGLCSERVIPMTGTPYNNRNQDMATLMVFIDPTLKSAKERWWHFATKQGAAGAVVRAVAEWNQSYLVRREKDVLTTRLPQRTVQSRRHPPNRLEMAIYETYEEKFLEVLKFFALFSDNGSPEARGLFQGMISAAAKMTMCLVHPLLPDGGRDWTIHFSPTRRRLANSLSRPNKCVCCRFKDPAKRTKKTDFDFQELFGGDDSEEDVDASFCEADYTNELIKIPRDLCLLASKGGPHHYACKECFDKMKNQGDRCPKCVQMENRAQIPRLEIDGDQHEDEPSGFLSPRTSQVGHLSVPDVLGGFRISTKLASIVSHLGLIPDGEKAIILSFFKGTLDLLEALLYHNLAVSYARYDGDITGKARQAELDKFKQDADCRVLLMTVQTGGTGLNIIEANHVIFVDRWLNPCVHEQAQDRCHRIGQTKDVFVTYHDAANTFDRVIKIVNETKTTNAAIVLADGTKLSAMAGLSYKEMTGLLGKATKLVRKARESGCDNVDDAVAQLEDNVHCDKDANAEVWAPWTTDPQIDSTLDDSVDATLKNLEPQSEEPKRVGGATANAPSAIIVTPERLLPRKRIVTPEKILPRKRTFDHCDCPHMYGR